MKRASARPSASAVARASSRATTPRRDACRWRRSPCRWRRVAPSTATSVAVNGGHRRGQQLDVPVAGADERDPLALALDDQPDRRALHASRRQAAVDPPPEHRRDLVPVQAVEDAPGLGGVDQAVVDLARVVDGVVDRGLGDLVEDHPLHRHLRVEVLEQVPRDRLALAVFVGREVQLGGVLERGTQVLDHLLAAIGQLVRRLEPVVDVDVEALARQVGDVPDRGAHVEGTAEELRDRLGLRGRLHDDQGLCHRALWLGDGGCGLSRLARGESATEPNGRRREHSPAGCGRTT